MFNKRNKLHKRLIQASSAEDVTRNHAYARVAGNSRAVPVRRPAPVRGQAVPGYRDSLVGSFTQYREKIPPQPQAPDTAANAVPENPIVGNRPASGASGKGKIDGDHAQRRHHFIEPPKRNFNRFD